MIGLHDALLALVTLSLIAFASMRIFGVGILNMLRIVLVLLGLLLSSNTLAVLKIGAPAPNLAATLLNGDHYIL